MKIELSNVSRVVRGGHTVLRDVSFTIEPGEMVAIVGASGAGKSTLLDVLAGVRQPTQGTRAPRREEVSFVTSSATCRKTMSCTASCRSRHASLRRAPAPARGTTSAEVDFAVSDALHSLELEHRADVKVGALSGGQRKRASIAAELLTRPRALFLDEPTSGLDPATAAGLMRTLRALADGGTTVVLHDPQHRRPHSDRPGRVPRARRLHGLSSASSRMPSSVSVPGTTPTSTSGCRSTRARPGSRRRGAGPTPRPSCRSRASARCRSGRC